MISKPSQFKATEELRELLLQSSFDVGQRQSNLSQSYLTTVFSMAKSHIFTPTDWYE